jgi:putative thioredoxin
VSNVTDATFQVEVLERSKTVPVVVDLWATWCGPCTTLGPMLESAVAARGGAVELAKVDVDANPGIAQMFQVQSIPAVFALVDGKVVDGFVGAVPAAEIDQFLDRIAPGPSEAELAAAAGDEAALRKVLEDDPGHPVAIAALSRALIDSDRSGEALELLARIPESAETRSLEAEARLALQAIDVRNLEIVPLLDELLERVATDDAARQEFVDLLETLGHGNPIASEYRKKLAIRLF